MRSLEKKDWPKYLSYFQKPWNLDSSNINGYLSEKVDSTLLYLKKRLFGKCRKKSLKNWCIIFSLILEISKLKLQTETVKSQNYSSKKPSRFFSLNKMSIYVSKWKKVFFLPILCNARIGCRCLLRLEVSLVLQGAYFKLWVIHFTTTSEGFETALAQGSLSGRINFTFYSICKDRMRRVCV